jgi:predicted transcriptional regulator
LLARFYEKKLICQKKVKKSFFYLILVPSSSHKQALSIAQFLNKLTTQRANLPSFARAIAV